MEKIFKEFNTQIKYTKNLKIIKIEEDHEPENKFFYRSIIGGLIHLYKFTLPNITFATNLTVEFSNNPTESYTKLFIRILRNLKETINWDSAFQNLLINCKLRRSQSSLHTARRCIPNVPTYISNDHEHQNGTINSSLVGVIIGDWKFYNHQGLCFNSKRSIRVGLMIITCGLMISQDRNLIRLFV
ncbi:hypothetical protein H8356DRAFT_1355145 [Neocallimastix lanati (nom. inval.)]|nr:hypothetical protein H8356DRAFT_1355145 [Neocallimastix sp. JGI-2020a]